MNAHQRRKDRRKLSRTTGHGEHRFIRHWKDLAQVPESETHRLEIFVADGNGYVYKKGPEDRWPLYLNTHTFYGRNYLQSTRRLRECGFNVTLANWDEKGKETT